LYRDGQGCAFITGNAKIAGMSKDLDLVGLHYNIAAAVFFVSRLLITFVEGHVEGIISYLTASVKYLRTFLMSIISRSFRLSSAYRVGISC